MFALFNNSTNVYLTHPKVGVWFCEKEEEAHEMYWATVNYLKSMGLKDFVKFVEIRELQKIDKEDNKQTSQEKT